MHKIMTNIRPGRNSTQYPQPEYIGAGELYNELVEKPLRRRCDESANYV